MASFQGGARGDAPPALVQDAVFDKVTALTVKDAVTAALYARDAAGGNGTGQLVEVSMLEAGQAFMWPNAMRRFTFVDADTKRPIPGPKIERLDVLPSAHGNYKDPLCGMPVLRQAEVHEHPQTVHNGNFLER